MKNKKQKILTPFNQEEFEKKLKSKEIKAALKLGRKTAFKKKKKLKKDFNQIDQIEEFNRNFWRKGKRIRFRKKISTIFEGNDLKYILKKLKDMRKQEKKNLVKRKGK